MMEDTFRYPVEKKTITSPYGTRRVFNGLLRSYHGGLDLRAYEGTPLYAAQSGVVKLAQDLFYSGNHVLIEHGMGIHTGYSHMSRLYVKTGDEVSRGQLLGLSGATGRVTAAHLHWTVSVGRRGSQSRFSSPRSSPNCTRNPSRCENRMTAERGSHAIEDLPVAPCFFADDCRCPGVGYFPRAAGVVRFLRSDRAARVTRILRWAWATWDA